MTLIKQILTEELSPLVGFDNVIDELKDLLDSEDLNTNMTKVEDLYRRLTRILYTRGFSSPDKIMSVIPRTIQTLDAVMDQIEAIQSNPKDTSRQDNDAEKLTDTPSKDGPNGPIRSDESLKQEENAHVVNPANPTAVAPKDETKVHEKKAKKKLQVMPDESVNPSEKLASAPVHSPAVSTVSEDAAVMQRKQLKFFKLSDPTATPKPFYNFLSPLEQRRYAFNHRDVFGPKLDFSDRYHAGYTGQPTDVDFSDTYKGATKKEDEFKAGYEKGPSVNPSIGIPKVIVDSPEPVKVPPPPENSSNPFGKLDPILEQLLIDNFGENWKTEKLSDAQEFINEYMNSNSAKEEEPKKEPKEKVGGSKLTTDPSTKPPIRNVTRTVRRDKTRSSSVSPDNRPTPVRPVKEKPKEEEPELTEEEKEELKIRQGSPSYISNYIFGKIGYSWNEINEFSIPKNTKITGFSTPGSRAKHNYVITPTNNGTLPVAVINYYREATAEERELLENQIQEVFDRFAEQLKKEKEEAEELGRKTREKLEEKRKRAKEEAAKRAREEEEEEEDKKAKKKK